MEWLYSAVGVSVSQSVTSCAMDQDECRRHTLSPSAGFEAVSPCNSMPPPARHVLLRRKAVPVATSISPRPPMSAWPDASSLRSQTNGTLSRAAQSCLSLTRDPHKPPSVHVASSAPCLYWSHSVSSHTLDWMMV